MEKDKLNGLDFDDMDEIEEFTDSDLVEVGDLEDFVCEQPELEVWVLGYNENDEITDEQAILATYNNEQDALAFAETVSKDYLREHNYVFDKEIKYLRIEIEEVIETEDGWFENVDTLYSRVIIL